MCRLQCFPVQTLQRLNELGRRKALHAVLNNQKYASPIQLSTRRLQTFNNGHNGDIYD